ncbi:MAG TPA: Ig-like domain repeat protein [Pirellulales bacterium]|jgi:hypothetical protein|nr:Ig-like domain repeat protein [Pirellulales bacterium]
MRARHRPRAWKLAACVLALSAWFCATVASAADGLPEPLCWRQQAFSIPFKIAQEDSPEQRAAEVRLYVSSNSGAKWDVAQTVSPRETSFTFRAPHDGEYWFQIRTADRQGNVSPAVGGTPELRVMVDTLAPRLDLTATRGEAGEVKAGWQAVDPLLDPDSLKIEYQTSAGTWRAVAVEHTAPGANRSTTTGTLTWFPTDAAAGSVEVRAEISDRAGNVTVSQAQAVPPGMSARHELTASNAAPKTSQTAQNWMSTPNPDWATVPGPRANPPRATAGSGVANSAVVNGGGTSWPADRASDLPLGRNPIPDDSTSRPPFASNQTYAANPHFNSNPSFNSGPSYSASGQSSGDVASRAVENVNPPIRNQGWPSNESFRNSPSHGDSQPYAGASGNASPASPSLSIPSAPPASAWPNDHDASAKNLLPPGERPRMVNSRTFDLDYEVDGIGPSGIARVELWGTRDGGRTWNSYGVDNDNRSPIRATVEGEGLYGFRVVVQSGNGLGGLPPHSGDAPDLWVMVDLTKPNVRLIDATAGDGIHSGELLLRWEASDATLAVRPITLLFSDRPGGKWSIIAAGLENTGQYAWRPDSRAPDHIYLRIEARDEAGNVGVFEAAQPVTLDRIRPEGRIRGVRPSSDTASGPAPGNASSTGPTAATPQMYNFSR